MIIVAKDWKGVELTRHILNKNDKLTTELISFFNLNREVLGEGGVINFIYGVQNGE